MDEYISREMEKQRETALTRLSLIMRTNYIDDFATVLAYGFFEGLPSAINIASECGLYEIDFCAIMRYGEDYADLWNQEQDDKKGEYLSDCANDRP